MNLDIDSIQYDIDIDGIGVTGRAIVTLLAVYSVGVHSSGDIDTTHSRHPIIA